MRLVVDANILVAELIRVRGRKLMVRPELELYFHQAKYHYRIVRLSYRDHLHQQYSNTTCVIATNQYC